jgi:hypothetical protein
MAAHLITISTFSSAARFCRIVKISSDME